MHEVSTINAHQPWKGSLLESRLSLSGNAQEGKTKCLTQAGEVGQNARAGRAAARRTEPDTLSLSLSWLWILKYSGFRYRA